METKELVKIIEQKTDLKYSYNSLSLRGGDIISPTGAMYKDIISLDFKSYYPSIIVNNKLFTQRLRDYLRHQSKLKDTGDADAKFVMNRIYGLLKHFDIKQTAEVTAYGRNYINSLREYLRDTGYNVIYSHTDSVFVSDIHGEDAKDVLLQKVQDYVRSYINSGLRIDIEHNFKYIYFKYNGKEYVKNRYIGVKQDNALYFNGFKLSVTGITLINLIQDCLSKGKSVVTTRELLEYIKNYVPVELNKQKFINLDNLNIIQVKRDYVEL